MLIDVVEIGAFATDVIYRADPNATVAGDAGAAPVSQRGRLFIPVRGDATMHWIDVEPGGDELDCGQGGRAFGGTCDDNHRRGDDPAQENTRDYSLPSEPYGIDADEDGKVIVVTHQTDGQLALFLNDWAGGPELKFVLGGLTTGAVAVASIPEPKIVDSSEKQAMQDAGVEPIPYQPSFLVAFRNSTEIRLVRFFADTPTDDPRGDGAEPERDFIEASQSTNITALSQGFESRGLAIDAAARQTCEQGCADDDLTCLGDCAGIPLGVYASNRRPSSLLLGETRPNSSLTSSDLPRFFDAVPVSPGAGRVVVGDVLGRDGTPVRRVFIVCFDARKLYIYDPVGARVEKVVQTGRGPHALAIHAHPSSDPEQAYALGYLAHFTDSYIGVIDLDQSHDTYGEIVLTLGHPSPPRSSK